MHALTARPIVWKKVNRFPYDVSACGQVRNRKTRKLLKPYANDSQGYLRVCLYGGPGGKRKFFYLHRLVALYHKPGRTRLRWQVNHLRWNLADCRAEALEWVTPRENQERKRRIYEASLAAYEPEPAPF